MLNFTEKLQSVKSLSQQNIFMVLYLQERCLFSVSMSLSPFWKLEMSMVFVCMYGLFILGDKMFKKIQ